MSVAAPPDDTLAAEYVLGLLEGDAAEKAERRLQRDRSFQLAVAAWRARLGEIDEVAERVPPSETLWPAIEAALSASLAPAPSMSPAPAEHAAAARLWNNLPFWRASAIASVAATLAFAAGLGAMLLEPAPRPALVAVLVTDTAQPGALVQAFGDGRVQLIPLSDIPVPEGRVLQVWTLQNQESGPAPVGLLKEARTVRLSTGALPPVQPSHLFEITLEPAGGSPTGRPTGPVLMKGLTNPTY